MDKETAEILLSIVQLLQNAYTEHGDMIFGYPDRHDAEIIENQLTDIIDRGTQPVRGTEIDSRDTFYGDE